MNSFLVLQIGIIPPGHADFDGAIARLAPSGCLPVRYRHMQEIFAEAVMLSESSDRVT
jgi:hypothetical protein